jgi:hypothetical protein
MSQSIGMLWSAGNSYDLTLKLSPEKSPNYDTITIIAFN